MRILAMIFLLAAKLTLADITGPSGFLINENNPIPVGTELNRLISAATSPLKPCYYWGTVNGKVRIAIYLEASSKCPTRGTLPINKLLILHPIRQTLWTVNPPPNIPGGLWSDRAPENIPAGQIRSDTWTVDEETPETVYGDGIYALCNGERRGTCNLSVSSENVLTITRGSAWYP